MAPRATGAREMRGPGAESAPPYQDPFELIGDLVPRLFPEQLTGPLSAKRVDVWIGTSRELQVAPVTTFQVERGF